MNAQDKPVRLCPICKKKVGEGRSAFCSPRCAKIDLGRWFNESYALPAEDEVEPDNEAD